MISRSPPLELRGSQSLLTAGQVPAFLSLRRQGAYAEPVPGPRLPRSLLMIIQNLSRTALLSDEGAAGQWGAAAHDRPDPTGL